MGSDFDSLLAQLGENYFNELPEKIDEMESYILQLIQGYDQTAFETVFRLVHSMKGSAGTYGYDILTTICHNLEDHFSNSQNDGEVTKESAELWLKYVDLLRRTYDVIASGSNDFLFVTEELDALRRTVFAHAYRGLIVVESDLDEMMIQQTFSDYPVALSVLHNGMEALERLLTDKFDFVIASNQLPRLNGIAVLSAIKQTPTMNKHLKTVLITSKTPTGNKRSGDPDYVISRNEDFAHSLNKVARALVS
ncbi:MAG: Hpt domain-containing protein [Gammaproteobacteria bacterium]|nr:Hpt domain-containing protein [Gammaproteobacteria bacterium]